MSETKFPLVQWFDLSKKITESDAETCAAQMSLYAYKDGLDPCSNHVMAEIRLMKYAVRAHNAPFNLAAQRAEKVKALKKRISVLEGGLAKSASQRRTLMNAQIGGTAKATLNKSPSWPVTCM